MAPSAQRISEDSWQTHKEQIIALGKSHKKTRVLEILRRDHEFDITLSQLEARLKLWEVRKNLNRAEWDIVLSKLDDIRASGSEGRVVISGRPVPEGSIRRARRHRGDNSRSVRNNNSHRLRKVDLTQVHLETLRHDGQWHWFTDFCRRDNSSAANIEPAATESSPLERAETVGRLPCRTNPSPEPLNSDLQDFPDVQPDDGMDFEHEIFNNPDAIVVTEFMDQDVRESATQSSEQLRDAGGGPYLESSNVPASGTISFQSTALSLPQNEIVMSLEPGHDVWELDIREEGLLQDVSGQPLALWGSQWLQNLPLRRLDKQLQIEGIALSEPWLVTPKAGQTQLVRQDQLQGFTRDLHQRMLSTLPEASNSFVNISIMTRRLKSRLESLLFQPTAPDNRENLHGALISEPEIFATHFNRILISALANGCAGLADVPIDLVLKHLMRYRHTSSMLLVFLRRSKTHAARALAENLFRAAIEARDAVALETILQIPSIDVNKILCHSNEWQPPGGFCRIPILPILHAANIGSLDLVRVLRKAGATCAQANESTLRPYSWNTFQGRQHDLPPIIRDYQLSIDIARELLLAGHGVALGDLRRIIACVCHRGPSSCTPQEVEARLSFNRDLAFLLATRFIQHAHSSFLLELRDRTDDNTSYPSLLPTIVSGLQDSQITLFIHDIIRICKREHDGVCLSHTDMLDLALVSAARGGKLESVRMFLRLIPHSKRLHQAFTAAITSGNKVLIDVVLAHNPDLNAPAHRLDPGSNQICSIHDYVTSFSQAVLKGNDGIMRLIQESGHLNTLETGFRFHPAVIAAVKTDDLVLLRNLMDHYQHPHPAELSQGLKEALKRGSEEAATMLLNWGASTSEWINPQKFSWVDHEMPLAALRDRNKYMVYAVLDAWYMVPGSVRYGVLHSTWKAQLTEILRTVAEWGDQSVFTALFTTFPSLTVEDDELAILLESGNHATFEFLLESGRVEPWALDCCLVYALRKGDESMIAKFLDLGANSADADVLEAAAEASLPTLKLILDHESTIKAPTGPGNGNDALLTAIKKGAQGLGFVECLLRSETVGLCIVPFMETLESHLSESTEVSAMGLAIEECCKSDEKDVRCVKLFLEAGYNPDSIVRSQSVPDHAYPKLPEADILLGSEEYLSNKTALLLAIELLNTNMVSLFLNHGANVNLPATCRILRTPLQKACEVGSLDIVKLLLDSGADPNAPPARCQGATALQLAAISGNCSIAAELLDRGANLYQPPVKAGGRWPLEGAAEHGRLEMIEFLWKVSITGFDKPICDFAMKAAEKKGHLACRDLIRDLVEHGMPDEGVESGIMDDLLELC